MFSDEETHRLRLMDIGDRLKTKADKAFREFAHWQFATNLFNNPYIDKVTAKALYDLTVDPTYKKLIVDLLILMYT
jgi:uncharacterized protein YneF (UPF0154 family)